MSTRTVPYTCPLRRAKSSMPSISGAVAASRSGRLASSRRIVDECTVMPSFPASRAPARPASSRPNPVSIAVSGTLRRQYLLVSPPACTANVAFGQDGFTHRNRRTRKMTSTGRPPAAPSATLREYPPWTRADVVPQAGQRPGEATHDAEITTASPVSSTWCTSSPASCGNSRASSFPPSSETSRTRGAARTEGTGVMADWSGNEAPGRAGILAGSCVLPEPRCHVTPTRQHTPDRDNPGDPAALTPRKPVQCHRQSATTKFAEEPIHMIMVRPRFAGARPRYCGDNPDRTGTGDPGAKRRAPH